MYFTEENPLSVSSIGAAVRNNDVEALRQSIAKGRSIDLKDNRGWAAIHTAASQNLTDCLNVLLDAGADSNIQTHEGETPLFLACAGNCYEAVVILLGVESLVNLPNNECVTPLHTVACRGFDKLATILLNKKANVNAQDYDLDTPLLDAVRHGHLKMCEILLSHGADQTIFCSCENLPIHIACLGGDLPILKILLKDIQLKVLDPNKIVNWINNDGYSPLMLAVQPRNVQCVEELLKSGADANLGVCHTHRLTALHLAAYYGNLPILKLILNATSKETIRRFCCDGHQGFRRTNLICNAILSQSEDCLAYLLDYGFEKEVLNASFGGTNPMSCLFSWGFGNSQLRFLEMLLESGYDPNSAQTISFYSFMEDASIQNELVETVVYKLVDHGLKVGLFPLELLIHGFIASCIRGRRFKLIPYMLQKSLIVEPHQVLDFLLHMAQRDRRYNVSILITFLSHYHSSSVCSPKKHNYLSHLVKFPSLKIMARSAIRKYIHCACATIPHQFKVRLNSFDLPQSLISYLNYEEMQTLYKSLENDKTAHNISMVFKS